MKYVAFGMLLVVYVLWALGPFSTERTTKDGRKIQCLEDVGAITCDWERAK